MKRVSIFTLGCKVNQYETEAMEELFQQRGYDIVENGKEAEVYVINTCTVTSLGDRKSRQFIRRAKKLNENSVVAVVGCYAQMSPGEVENMKDVDVIIGTVGREKVVDLCEEAMKNKKKINIVGDIKKFRKFEDLNINEVKLRTRAYIKIQDGCNQYCSYCIIPYARGPVRSRSLESILKEAERLRDKGFKEIILTGIHIASYGKDLKDVDLLNVLEELDRIEGIERIRLGSLEPTLIDEKFMNKVSSMKKICNHFHISLQSGSDSVLKRMNRKYSVEQYKKIVNIIRYYMKDVGITTDIIVGFPGETEEEFKETCNFVREIGFSRIHVFKYSQREGTPASKFKSQIDGYVKHERSEILIKIGNEMRKDFEEKFIGKSMPVLYEEDAKDKKGYVEGYTTNYMRVISKNRKSLKGKIVSTKIIELAGEKLIGEIEEF